MKNNLILKNKFEKKKHKGKGKKDVLIGYNCNESNDYESDNEEMESLCLIANGKEVDEQKKNSENIKNLLLENLKATSGKLGRLLVFEMFRDDMIEIIMHK